MIPSLLTDTVSYDLERAVHYALLWGLEAIELRTVDGPDDRVPYVNEAKLKGRIMGSDLPVVAVDPGTFFQHVDERAGWLNALAELDETLQFCRRIGCGRVVVSSLRGDGPQAFDAAVEALGRAGRQASKRGIQLCVLNEREAVARDGRRLAALIDAVGSDALAAAWDPSEAAWAGENPDDGLRAVGERVGLVRCRRITEEGNGSKPASIDKRKISWPDQLRILRESGFQGPISLSVEGEPIGKKGLHDATALIRTIRAVQREGKQSPS